MADRLLPHVQAYENSGLARFGVGAGNNYGNQDLGDFL